jgi:hypothetical protein
MWRKSVLALFATLILVLLSVGTAQAHQSLPIGPYTLEYGWLSEPPVVGQSNAIVINVSQASPASTNQPSGSTSAESAKPIDITDLKVEVVYGGDSKFLTLQPLSEDSLNQYIAPILPTRAGTFTLRLSGTLGAVPVQADVQPEEVQTADVLQFPRGQSDQSASASSDAPLALDWLGVGGILLGAVGTALGLLALLRRPAR